MDGAVHHHPAGDGGLFRADRPSGKFHAGKYRARRRAHGRAAALHQAGGHRHRSVRADRLPAGLHPLPQKGLSEADAVYHGDAADVDELSAAHLCVDDHFGKQRPHQ